MIDMVLQNASLCLKGELLIQHVPTLVQDAVVLLDEMPGGDLTVDLSGVQQVDSGGAAFLDWLQHEAENRELLVRTIGASENILKALETFHVPALPPGTEVDKVSFFERIGTQAVKLWQRFGEFLYLIADSAYYSVIGLFNHKGMRKGEFVNQGILIGMNAFPIVSLISFLIGFILALQSAAQLRQFGASIYVADLIAISMTREMGPLITAILFAGRSGSAIASEIATMVVTEETDALRSMGLNPIRYILTPKIHAISITMPLLTLISIVIGILGAAVIGYAYLDIGLKAFYQEVLTVLELRDIFSGLVKSLVFAWIIALTGAYYGFHAKGGAEGVGRMTTAAVVASIFWVILADSLLGLFFYFGRGMEY